MSDYIVNKYLDEDGLNLKHVENRTYDRCFRAVKSNTDALMFVEESKRTPEMLAYAVSSDPWALRYVSSEKQTEEMCLDAVSKDWWVLKYIFNKTEYLCYLAAKQNKFALDFVDDKFKSQRVMDSADRVGFR